MHYDCVPTAENQPPTGTATEYRNSCSKKHEGNWLRRGLWNVRRLREVGPTPRNHLLDRFAITQEPAP